MPINKIAKNKMRIINNQEITKNNIYNILDNKSGDIYIVDEFENLCTRIKLTSFLDKESLALEHRTLTVTSNPKEYDEVKELF